MNIENNSIFFYKKKIILKQLFCSLGHCMCGHCIFSDWLLFLRIGPKVSSVKCHIDFYVLHIITFKDLFCCFHLRDLQDPLFSTIFPSRYQSINFFLFSVCTHSIPINDWFNRLVLHTVQSFHSELRTY